MAMGGREPVGEALRGASVVAGDDGAVEQAKVD